MQATWNLLEPSAGAALAEAHAAGLGVIVKEALANGRLTARNSAPAFADIRARLEARGAPPRHLDRRPRHRRGAGAAVGDVVLSGAATVEHLCSNLSALAVRLDDAASEALASLREEPHAYWTTRSALPWN